MDKWRSVESVINRIIATIEMSIVPLCGVVSIWGFDISIYVGALAAGLLSVLSYAKTYVHYVIEKGCIKEATREIMSVLKEAKK